MPFGGFRRRRSQAQLGKPHGHPTRPLPLTLRRPVVVLAATVPAARLRRQLLLLKYGVSRGLAKVDPRVLPIRVVRATALRQALRPRLFSRTRLGRTPVRPPPLPQPPVHRPRVVLATIVGAARLRRQFLLLKYGLGRGLAKVDPRVAPIRVVRATGLRQALRPRLFSRALLRRPQGHVTRKPPIRPVRVALFAAQARSRQRFIHERALLEHVVRTFAPGVSAVVPLRSMRGVGR